MKIEANQVRFTGVNSWFGRRALRFIGKANTIQLLETALVIEGYRKTIGYPVLDFLFQWALSEWTTVTVPYSRVVSCRLSRRWLIRGLVFVILPLPLFGMLVGSIMMLFAGALSAATISSGMMSLFMLVFTIWAMFRLLRARYSLKFRLPDGRYGLTNFRIKSRKVRRAFEDILESNRKAALIS